MLHGKIFNEIQIKPTHYHQVHGGDINEAYCIQTTTGKYFLKVNDELLYPAMFEKEADGLTALHNNSNFLIPKVIKTGCAAGKQFILMEWIEEGVHGKTFWENFGRDLAHLHRQSQTTFGWHTDNYIGSLPQVNTQYNSWHEFYSSCRILPMTKRLFQLKRFNSNDVKAAESLCNKLENLFPNEQPSLLHGDLWNGNFMFSSIGKAAIFDPAVYCGHREMDIGMTLLFGGFDKVFYKAYHEAYPLETRWQQRLQLTQLYPLLVHAILFGGTYITRCRETVKLFFHWGNTGKNVDFH